MDRIPLLAPAMPSADALLPYLRRIDENRWYTNFGPLSAEFEQRLIEHTAPTLTPRNVTTVANCTLGLELALQAHGLRSGAHVLIPAITFVATATAIVRTGMMPVIADVDASTWLLTPQLALAASRSRELDLVMPVATFGCPHDVKMWDAFTQETGIPVVIDAAGAYGNQMIGASTDVIFSFHATKSFGTGEGGAVFSASQERIAQVRYLANFGIDTSISQLSAIGTNAKMSEYHCAIGLASFDIWEQTRCERRSLYPRYVSTLRELCPNLTFQVKPENGVYPLMSVLLPKGVKAAVIAKKLDRAGIETRRWYSPGLHLHPALANTLRTGVLTIADDVGERILGLPFFIGLTEAQLEYIGHSLAAALD